MARIDGLPTVQCPVCLEHIPVTMTDEDAVTVTGGVPEGAEVMLTVRIEHTCRATASVSVHAGPDGPVRGFSVTVPGIAAESGGPS
jgi:hypothetical protein